MKRHQHYISPTDKKLALAAAFFPKNYHRKELNEPRYSKSLNNIAKNSTPVFSTRVPQSMSAIEEDCENWKIPFCGMRSRSQISDDEDQDEDQVTERSKIMRKSYSYQSTMPAPENEREPDSTVSSPPIPVPLRGNRKRKSNFRNSGGYFFDKYMKRFREKCSLSLHRCQSVDVVENTVEDDMEAEERISTITSMKNNREDMAGIDIDHRIAPVDRPRDLPLGCVEFDCDDLYPLRFGSSECWNFPLSLGSSSLIMDSPSVEGFIDPSGNQLLPIDLPCFWGDAVSGGEHHFENGQNLSRTSSVMNSIATSCRYSDTNSETLKAMETLYLCNFKVSTNGDWLCLKEVLDDTTICDSIFASNMPADLDRSSVTSELSANEDGESQSKVEKRNLLGMAKLSIKGLIESSLSAGHTLDSDHVPLQQFFVIIEYIMRQGLKAPKNFFIQNKYFWPVLENVEKFASDAAEITDSARNLPVIRTYLGRGRAWLRLALMKKKLADYMKVIVNNKSCFSEWYETDALLMCEEGTVLIGHLVGLNCIDANLCMKGDDLDNQVTVIDYSLYMKRNNVPTLNQNNEEGGDGGDEQKSPKEEKEVNTVQKLTDQKNYMEERNRYLETTTSELLKRSQTLEISNTQLEAELKATKIQLHTLQSDRERILSEKENLTLSYMKTLEDREKDLDLERETLRNSKSELDDMFQQIQKQLRHETNMRMDVERELELQMSLKQELEMSMKLLEKDVYEKQDGVVTLREQLDNVKAINQDIYKKLQEKTGMAQEKSKSIIKLEGETQKLATKVVKMQQQLAEAERQVNYARERVEQLTFELDDSEKQRTAQTTNLQIEREWREALQGQIVNHEEEKLKLREQVNKLQIIESELFDIQQERDRLRETNLEQEITIQDLAGHLGQSKQEIGEIKETVKTVVGTKWEQDKAVTECIQCAKSFNISRRKHHCRNCGQIFCNSCSDNVMPLASSAKPVRVCDNCHNTLLQRFSANTNT